ncbi:hypothetical protein LX32DRAFT_14458 [Colletotrichum zoysiae]|uniref:Uncharacterized protein n=1 Tax=Colletotrichum zoysiae TaxID=1216348 RepID=A0AAD9LY57_9PEZI|nr:hypothetical protein LX32DRAFT_14458 [Colletotrichum zoysiae]
MQGANCTIRNQISGSELYPPHGRSEGETLYIFLVATHIHRYYRLAYGPKAIVMPISIGSRQVIPGPRSLPRRSTLPQFPSPANRSGDAALTKVACAKIASQRASESLTALSPSPRNWIEVPSTLAARNHSSVSVSRPPSVLSEDREQNRSEIDLFTLYTGSAVLTETKLAMHLLRAVAWHCRLLGAYPKPAQCRSRLQCNNSFSGFGC